MNAADRTFMARFHAALATAHATADRIATGSMSTLRREMAAEALRSFAEEARVALDLGIRISASDLGLHNFMQTSLSNFGQGFDALKFEAVATQSAALTAIGLGYVGEACPECANFTLVRNGTCLKCDTCGSTTGCS